MSQDRLLEELIELEVALHRPTTRRSVAALDTLLHPRFREFGRSGRSYTKAEVLASLPFEQEAFVVWSQDYELELLAEGCALLTYRCFALVGPPGEEQRTGYSNRSSIWQRTASGWQMLFHQGTTCEPFEPARAGFSSAD